MNGNQEEESDYHSPLSTQCLNSKRCDRTFALRLEHSQPNSFLKKRQTTLQSTIELVEPLRSNGLAKRSRMRLRTEILGRRQSRALRGVLLCDLLPNISSGLMKIFFQLSALRSFARPDHQYANDDWNYLTFLHGLESKVNVSARWTRFQSEVTYPEWWEVARSIRNLFILTESKPRRLSDSMLLMICGFCGEKRPSLNSARPTRNSLTVNRPHKR